MIQAILDDSVLQGKNYFFYFKQNKYTHTSKGPRKLFSYRMVELSGYSITYSNFGQKFYFKEKYKISFNFDIVSQEYSSLFLYRQQLWIPWKC